MKIVKSKYIDDKIFIIDEKYLNPFKFNYDYFDSRKTYTKYEEFISEEEMRIE